MKFSKLGLLTLLISLFILNSCKNQDAIGLGVNDSTQLSGTLLVDTNITVNTMLDDTVATTGLARSPLAYFKDPELGTTETSFSTLLTLPGGTAYTLPTGVVTIDSALLILPYAPSGFYGDSLTSKFKVDVHQLDENFIANRTYYSNKVWDFNSQLLGTKTFIARSHDTLKVYTPVKGKPDTLVKVSPQIRIPISQTFIDQYLFNGPSVYLSNVTLFQNAIRGLYINIDKAQTTGPGGNLMFTLDSARISVYYRATTSSAVDTAMVTLPVPASQHSTQIKHTYSAKVQAALNNTSTDGLMYLQGLSGLRTKISFPDIKKAFASLGSDVVINRAELVITPAPGTTIPYGPAPRLTMYQFDIAKQRIRIQDASTSDPRGVNGPLYFNGFYNKAKNQYQFLVTAYIQDLYRGKTVDYGTFIAPVDPASSTTINILPTASYAERTIGIGKNSQSRIKLNIIYTKINQ